MLLYYLEHIMYSMFSVVPIFGQYSSGLGSCKNLYCEYVIHSVDIISRNETPGFNYISVATDGHKHYGACVVETRPHTDAVESADAIDIQGRSVSCLFVFVDSVVIPLSPVTFTIHSNERCSERYPSCHISQ